MTNGTVRFGNAFPYFIGGIFAGREAFLHFARGAVTGADVVCG